MPIGQTQVPDVLGQFMRGRQARRDSDQMQRDNAMQQFVQERGADLYRGDQNAMAQLAQFSPEAAMNMQGQRLQMQGQQQAMAFNEERMSMARQAAARDAASHVAGMNAADAARESEAIKSAVSAGLQAETPEQWDSFMTQNGQEDLVGRFGDRDMIAGSYLGIADALDMSAGPEPVSAPGKIAADRAAGILPELDPNAPPPIDFDNEQKLRREFLALPAVKAFSSQSQAYGRIRASSESPSAAGDLAMIFNYMKLLDPGSVVRESEFETAAQATAWMQESEETGATVPQPIAAAIRKMATGQRLSPGQRQDFVDRSERLYSVAESDFGGIEEQYKSLAGEYNLDPDRAFINFRTTLDPYITPPVAPDSPIEQSILPPIDGMQDISDEDLMRMLDGG